MTLELTNQVTYIDAAKSLAGKPQARLGLINYINSLPFVLPILDKQVDIPAETFFTEPAKLNALYASQNLDLGAISAFSFLQQGNLQIMTSISIASRGPVGSVLFFSKGDIERQQVLKIAVPNASATAVNLLQILLLEHGYKQPIIIPSEQPNLSADEIDAALVIGDQALIVDPLWSKQYMRIDLGQWWYERYALPAVFGVFAARQDWLKDNNGIGKIINESLLQAVKLGLSDYFDKVLTAAQAKIGLSKERLTQYFKEELNYAFGSEHQLALNKYQALCRQYGLLR